MATPTLKYVAPTTPEDELTFAPEPVVIYGVPSGGGGGGAVDSVNGQTGVVELAVADIPDLQDELDSKAPAADVADFAQSVSAQFTTVAGQIADKANTSDVTNQLATKASATDLDNVFTVATDAQSDATAALSALSSKANTADVVPNTRTVAGKALSDNVTLVKGDVGLGNVDNTSDANKPVSTATQTALNGKVNALNGVSGLWKGTAAQYAALTPDANTVYIVQG